MGESRQRIQAALKNCGYEMPQTKVTINLAPADMKKEDQGLIYRWRWAFLALTTRC